MAREILFKAKHIHAIPTNKHLEGRWIEGYLCSENYINSPELEGEFLIDPNTICQYTGLTDKNGNRIWENDVAKYKNPHGIKCNGVTLNVIGKVVYNEKTASFAICGQDELGAKHCDYFPIKNIEVIGNIFDNPELLGGGE